MEPQRIRRELTTGKAPRQCTEEKKRDQSRGGWWWRGVDRLLESGIPLWKVRKGDSNHRCGPLKTSVYKTFKPPALNQK